MSLIKRELYQISTNASILHLTAVKSLNKSGDNLQVKEDLETRIFCFTSLLQCLSL